MSTNDGIVSVAAIVVGIAGATSNTGPILTALYQTKGLSERTAR